MKKAVLFSIFLFLLASSTSHASLVPLFRVIATEALKSAATEVGKTAVKEFMKLFNDDKEIAKKGKPQLKEEKLVKEKRIWTISPGKLSKDDLKELAKILKSIDNDMDQVIKIRGSDNVVATSGSGNVNLGTYQEILGSNSVTSFNQQGGMTANTINIAINEWKEIKRLAEEAIADHEKGKEIEIAEYKRRLAEIHKVEYDVLPKEADEWAKSFIDSLPLRKDKFKTIENDKRITAERVKNELPIIFDYIFQSLDTKILALQKHIPDIRLERPDNYELVVDLDVSNSIPQYHTRKITFPNKHSIVLILTPGETQKGIFTSYPNLQFYAVENSRKKYLFCIFGRLPFANVILGHPGMPDVIYGDSPDEAFKDTISKQFDKLIEIVYLGE
jgi:hypothetical protein